MIVVEDVGWRQGDYRVEDVGWRQGDYRLDITIETVQYCRTYIIGFEAPIRLPNHL